MATAMAGIRDGSMSYSYVESTFNIPRGTIHGRINGALERHIAHAHERRLTLQQEEGLAKWILDLDRQHQPPSHARCRLMAISI